MYPYDHQLLLNTQVTEANCLRFDLDPDLQRWPWLALPAWHPALPGKLSFFTGIKAGEELFKMSSKLATAVTRITWENHDACLLGQRAAGGLIRTEKTGERFHYDSDLQNAVGTTQQLIRAEGVVFSQRDFKGWRRKMKQAIQTVDNMRPQDFGFAEPASTGVATRQECFVSPLHESRQGLACYALLDADSGFTPQHPWHSGTGDHVNASHQLDIAWQASHLIGRAQGWWPPGQMHVCSGGQAAFRNYLELGVPIALRLNSWKPLNNGWRLRFGLSQAGKLATEIRLDLIESDSGH